MQRAPLTRQFISESHLVKKNSKKFAFGVRVSPILCTYISERTFQPQLHTNGERRFERYVQYRNTSRARQARVRENTRWMQPRHDTAVGERERPCADDLRFLCSGGSDYHAVHSAQKQRKSEKRWDEQVQPKRTGGESL